MDDKIKKYGFEIIGGMEDNINPEDTFEYWFGTDDVDEYIELWLQGKKE
jgi:hypothetical protein